MLNNKKKIAITMLALTTAMTGCSGKQFLGQETRNALKKEMVVQKDPFASLSVDQKTKQVQEKNGVTVEIGYLRDMKESDYNCLPRVNYDPLNPQLLFAFRLLNTGNKIRNYEPVFAFKGSKNLNLAKTDPCSFFTTYGHINYVMAKPGNTVPLGCGVDERYNDRAGMVTTSQGGKVVTLYPDIPQYGILVVSQQALDKAAINKDGVKLSKVKGWASFYEKVNNGEPQSFRFNYSFTRKDWLDDVQYEKSTAYTYEVNLYQKTTDTILLGTINGDKVEEKVEGSEQYDRSIMRRIGLVSEQSQ